jgi:hypothetical protein
LEYVEPIYSECSCTNLPYFYPQKAASELPFRKLCILMTKYRFLHHMVNLSKPMDWHSKGCLFACRQVAHLPLSIHLDLLTCTLTLLWRRWQIWDRDAWFLVNANFPNRSEYSWLRTIFLFIRWALFAFLFRL